VAVSPVALAAIDLDARRGRAVVPAVVFVIAITDSILTVKIDSLRVLSIRVKVSRNNPIIDLVVHPTGALVDFIRIHALQPRDLIRQLGAEDSLLRPGVQELAQAIAEGRAGGHRVP
jgi:hypothetical protein